MFKIIVIDFVIWIEGYVKIFIFFNDQGNVDDVCFYVVEYWGFEKFCEGCFMWEMVGIIVCICGICLVSYLFCVVKIGDKLLVV